MRVAVLLSGGKDSVFSLYKAVEKGNEVKYLITLFPKRADSWMFHRPCIELTALQAKALEIEHVIRETPGEKEKELIDLEEALKAIKSEIEGVVSGAIASTYQKSRIDGICKKLGLKSISPLWNSDPEKILREEISLGFEIMITGVYAEGFDGSWLGRKIDERCLEDLIRLKERYKIHLSGEGGEYETFVLDCPLFKQRIEILEYKKIWDEKTKSGYIEVEKARLISK